MSQVYKYHVFLGKCLSLPNDNMFIPRLIPSALDISSDIDMSCVSKHKSRFVYTLPDGRIQPLLLRIREPRLSVSDVGGLSTIFTEAKFADPELAKPFEELITDPMVFVVGPTPTVYSLSSSSFVTDGYLRTMEGLVASDIVEIVVIPVKHDHSESCFMQIICATIE